MTPNHGLAFAGGALLLVAGALAVRLAAPAGAGEPTDLRLRPDVIRIEESDSGLEERDGVLFRDGVPFEGQVIERHDTGARKRLTGYRRGRKHGSSVAWYPDGALWYAREFREGRESGVHRGWWPDGTPRFRMTFQNGVYEGTSRMWYADGAPYRESNYVEGREEGSQRMWASDGGLRANYVVRDGRRYGLGGSKGCASPGEES